MLLLQPVSFILQIKRNLSAAWYRAIPDVEMSGRLKRIDVLLNQEDYGTIMTTLSENLGEGAEDGIAQAQAAAARVDKRPLADEPIRTSVCELAQGFSRGYRFFFPLFVGSEARVQGFAVSSVPKRRGKVGVRPRDVLGGFLWDSDFSMDGLHVRRFLRMASLMRQWPAWFVSGTTFLRLPGVFLW